MICWNLRILKGCLWMLLCRRIGTIWFVIGAFILLLLWLKPSWMSTASLEMSEESNRLEPTPTITQTEQEAITSSVANKFTKALHYNETTRLVIHRDQPRNQTTVKHYSPNWEETLPYRVNKSAPSDALWMPILGTSHGQKKGGFVYSAYLDTRGRQALVRVLAVLPTNFTSVLCRYHYSEEADLSPITKELLGSGQVNSKIFESIRLDMQVGNSTHVSRFGYNHKAVFILCPLKAPLNLLGTSLPDTTELLPISVSVYPPLSGSSAETPPAGNNLYIHPEPKTKVILAGGLPSYSACSATVRLYFSDIVKLVEFLEFSYVLGAVYFPLYGYTYSKQVDCVLKQYYANSTLNPDFKVDFLNYELPYYPLHIEELRSVEPETAASDCFYRSRAVGHVQFVANGDVDEVFLPTRPSPNVTFGLSRELQSQMMQHPTAAGFSIKRENLYLVWPDDPRAQQWTRLVPLRVARKTRMTLTSEGDFSPKVIHHVDRSIRQVTHFSIEDLPGFEVIKLSMDSVVGHHYRELLKGSRDRLALGGKLYGAQRTQVTEAAIPYLGLLEKRVKRFLDHVPKECNVPRDLWEQDVTKFVGGWDN